jgi:HEAT repeat protein
MNIVYLHDRDDARPKELGCLFDRMETAMHSTNADFEKSIRLAKTLAPLLCDQTSNARHIETISSTAPVHEKVIAILMLGFPKNRAALPFLQDVLHTGKSALRMASAIAIGQMRDADSNAALGEVLHNAYHQEASLEVKNAIRQALHAVLGKNAPDL